MARISGFAALVIALVAVACSSGDTRGATAAASGFSRTSDSGIASASTDPASGSADRANRTSATSVLPPDVHRVLDEIKAADTDLLAVSEEDGRFLRVMIASTGATRALEIGGANGYSAIWIGLGLRQTGGRLTTIEYDPARAKQAAENIRRAGLADIVTVVSGDAFEHIPTLEGEFDFVFLDAWKRDYKRFLDLVFPRLLPGGVFLAHNVVNKSSEMPDFLDAIRTDPRMFTSIVTPSGEGISITVKTRAQ